MPFNLPPPWDPGFALPENVPDEGLERRAFVTQMRPRGTYDDPAYSTGRWALPGNVRSEKLGQGTYTTKMALRGSYNGPPVPFYLNRRPMDVQTQRAGGVNATFRAGNPSLAANPVVNPAAHALSGTDLTPPVTAPVPLAIVEQPLPAPYDALGQRTAQTILAQLAPLPPAQFRIQLRQVMDHLDRSLARRTADIAARYRRQGMTAQQAFPRALGRAIGAGMAAEAMRRGSGAPRAALSGTSYPDVPGFQSGRYGMAGWFSSLGDDAQPGLATNLARASVGQASTSKLAAVLPPPACLPNPPFGYTWNLAKQKFVAIKPGNIRTPKPAGRDGTPACVTIADVEGAPEWLITVGPFMLPATVPSQTVRFDSPATVATQMPADWKRAIQQAFNVNAPGKDNANPQQLQPSPTPGVPTAYEWLAAMGVNVNAPIDFNVIATPKSFQASWWDAFIVTGLVDAVYQGVAQVGDLTGPPQPIAQFKHPVLGGQWGVWMRIQGHQSATGATRSWLEIFFAPMPSDPWYKTLLQWIFWPVVEVAQGGKAVVSLVGKAIIAAAGLLCDLGGLAPIAGAGAGAATGGVAGAKIGLAAGSATAGACAPKIPPPAPPSSWTVPLLVAGGVGFVALLATHKKRT